MNLCSLLSSPQHSAWCSQPLDCLSVQLSSYNPADAFCKVIARATSAGGTRGPLRHQEEGGGGEEAWSQGRSASLFSVYRVAPRAGTRAVRYNVRPEGEGSARAGGANPGGGRGAAARCCRASSSKSAGATSSPGQPLASETEAPLAAREELGCCCSGWCWWCWWWCWRGCCKKCCWCKGCSAKRACPLEAGGLDVVETSALARARTGSSRMTSSTWSVGVLHAPKGLRSEDGPESAVEAVEGVAHRPRWRSKSVAADTDCSAS
mmetsp:Transcript_17943/g.51452  ORF Transcript_17943/g.51452 Transcript_17943/m.51452 type:complete len:264 (+) Transcript_17943:308-1099(+)